MNVLRCLKVAQLLLPAALVAFALAGCGSPSALPEASPVPVTETAEPASPTSPPATRTALPEPTTTLQPTSTPEAPTATEPPTAVPTNTPELPPVTPTEPPSVMPTEPPEPSSEPSEVTPTDAPSAEPEPTATVAPVPKVLSFRISPEVTQNIGDKLTIEWEAVGERAELCPISGRGPVEVLCEDVPLSGKSEFVTDEKSMTYTGFGLRATAGDVSTWGTVQLKLQCLDFRPWFFDGAPQRCPESSPLESYAAGQYFEGGMMMWVKETDDFYVFYEGEDAHGFQTFDWVLDAQGSVKPGASVDDRIGVDPPEGLLEPVSGFGLVWRGEIMGVRDDVRERLGWATEAEFGFDTAYQCITPSHPGLWSCYLQGPRGEILYLHPDSTAQVRFLWEGQ